MPDLAADTERLAILVIGGGGFVSRAVCVQALAAGHAVWAVTRSGRNLPSGVTPIIADRKDSRALAQGLRATGRRWHLAVDCIGYSRADALQDIEIVAPLSEHLAFVSTDAVFDFTDPTFRKDESFGRFSSHPYGVGKRAGEEALLARRDVTWTIFRPSHVFGPGSELGCLPLHLRDRSLVEKIRAGAELRLVGGGFLLQQPVHVLDLARLILSCFANPASRNQIFMAVGPEIIEARRYYELVGEMLGLPVTLAECPVREYLDRRDRFIFTICHRVYAMDKAIAAGLSVPTTPIRDALRDHVRWICERSTAPS